MKTIRKEDIPIFHSEAEEANFWSTHEFNFDEFTAREMRTDLRLPTRDAKHLKARFAKLEPHVAAAFPSDEAVNEALKLVFKAAKLPIKKAS
jgi:hypothetical protein